MAASTTTRETVISLLNDAQLAAKEDKVDMLRKVKELVVYKEVELLDSFFDEIVAFQQDSSQEVRKFLAEFIEEVCKRDELYSDRALPSLVFLLEDERNQVIKKVATAARSVYPLVLKLLGGMKALDDSAAELWDQLGLLKSKLLQLVYSDNDGIRMLAIKFMETAAVTQTDNTILKANHPLRDEAVHMVHSLQVLAQSGTISHSNILACLTSLVAISRERPQYVCNMVEVMETLPKNLDNFTASQKNSLKKFLKMQGLSLLKTANFLPFSGRVGKVLIEQLECSPSEVSKAKSVAEANYRENLLKMETEIDEDPLADEPSAKRPREEGGMGEEFSGPLTVTAGEPSTPAPLSGQQRRRELTLIEDISSLADKLAPSLTPTNVVEMVLNSMEDLPQSLPSFFVNSYKVTHQLGSTEQVQEIACLLATQMLAKHVMATQEELSQTVSSSTLVGVRAWKKRQSILQAKDEATPFDPSRDESPTHSEKESIKHLSQILGVAEGILSHDPDVISYVRKNLNEKSETIQEQEGASESALPESLLKKELSQEENVKKILSGVQAASIQKTPHQMLPEKAPQTPTHIQKLKRSKLFFITDLATRISPEEAETLSYFVFDKLLASLNGSIRESWQHIDHVLSHLVVSAASTFGGLKEAFAKFILSDVKRFYELAMKWLFHEYVQDAGGLSSYEETLMILLENCQTELGPRNKVFSQLLQDAPFLTSSALQMIEAHCHTEEYSVLGLTALRDLVLKRGSQEGLLQILLDATMSGSQQCRANALAITKKLYSTEEIDTHAEDYMQSVISKLTSDPPSEEDRHLVGEEWNESSVNLCLSLFCILLPFNKFLLLKLSNVYAGTSAPVKKLILQQIESVISDVPLTSPAILRLIEKCPSGSETLVLRVLSLLCKGGVPPLEVVAKTKRLYDTSGKDVRLLIPVLKGLTKTEIGEALPKFVLLSSNMMKGLYQKLILVEDAPMEPADLLVALHNVDCRGNENLMKAVIKATNLCFSDKATFTAEVLVTAVQNILNISPTPTIFMRTVLQSFNLYPQLLMFIVEVLQELVAKQVWADSTLWQGFIHCLEVTQPHSVQVLTQLPQEQLVHIMNASVSLQPFIAQYLEEISSINSLEVKLQGTPQPNPPGDSSEEMIQVHFEKEEEEPFPEQELSLQEQDKQDL